MKRHTLSAAVLALLVLAPWHQAVRAEPPQYTVQNLGTYGVDALVPTVAGVNASGQVAGNVSNALVGSMAVRYTGGFWQSLPGLDDAFSFAFGINAAGDIVGYRMAPSGARAFRYSDANGVQDIEPLPGGSMTIGFAMNDAGDVVGFSDSSAGVQPFILRHDELLATALPSLGGGFAYACGINNAGQVSGISFNLAGAQHGMRIAANGIDVDDVGALDGAAGSSDACAIDGDGRVGGQSSAGAGVLHAFRFVSVAPVDLDTFGSSSSKTESIAAGVSVGWYETVSGFRAFAHRDADGSFDLNTRISDAHWVLLQARGVNTGGMIAGDGTFDGQPAAFLLTPNTADTTPPVILDATASPNSIYPPNGQMVNVTVAVNATDNSGDAPVCTLTSITGGAGDSTVTPSSLSGSVRATAGTVYTLNVTCVDAAGNDASAATSVTVETDHVAPVISAVSATPDNLWPPDNRLVPVTVSVSATDDVDSVVACSLKTITGGAAGDATIYPPLNAKLRAVGGTTYTLKVRCADAAGNASYAATTVIVPPDTTEPEITALSANPSNIWPANGKLVPVQVSVSAIDDVDGSPSCSVSGVTGAPASDYAITGPFSLKLRATKNASYMVSVTCVDDAGNDSVAAVTVSVSKDDTPNLFHFNRRLRMYLRGLAHAYGHDRHDRR
jgi:probable HAF family extracellular repeat protein